MSKVYAGFAAAFLCAACVERVDGVALIDARFDTFNGMTVAQFAMDTGLVPYDHFDTNSGRTFLVSGPTSSVFIPPTMGAPGVVAHNQCLIQLMTQNVDGRATADSWVIQGTARRGNCANV